MQSLNKKRYVRSVFHNKFRMKFHDQKTLPFSFQKQPFADNFQKQSFLNISRNSQENTCVVVTF